MKKLLNCTSIIIFFFFSIKFVQIVLIKINRAIKHFMWQIGMLKIYSIQMMIQIKMMNGLLLKVKSIGLNKNCNIKLINLARVIKYMNDGNGPDILGIEEVENQNLLVDLIDKYIEKS